MRYIDYVFYCLAALVLVKLYSIYSDWRLRTKTGGLEAPTRSGLTDPFGLRTLLEAIRLSWTLNNYEYFKGIFDTYGHTVQATVLGERVFLTINPENIKAILATQFESYGKGERSITVWTQFLGNGIFNADGHTWKHSRAMLRPQFLRNRIADLDIMQKHTDTLNTQIVPGQVTDFHELAFRMTLDTATDYLFGDSTNTLEAATTDRGFAHTFAKIQELQTKRMMYGPLWKVVSFGPHLDDLDKFVDRYVQETLAKSVEEKVDDENASFLDVLAQNTRDPVVLRDQLISTLLAGRDTTAATLSWLLKHLSHNPSAYAKLRTEVLEVLGSDGRATYSQLKNMSFLNACIDETLRLYPIVPMNEREALTDTTLPRGGGTDGLSPVAVRKGDVVWYIPLVMHRTQDIPDTEEWIPERWSKWTPKPWTYIPFNGGPRICLGQNFAQVEMAVVLASIAQRFSQLENQDDQSSMWQMRFDIILTPRHGTKVKFIL